MIAKIIIFECQMVKAASGSLSNQLAIANESLGGRIVVVMVERYKEEMEQARDLKRLTISEFIGKRREPGKKEKKQGSGIEMPRLREAIINSYSMGVLIIVAVVLGVLMMCALYRCCKAKKDAKQVKNKQGESNTSHEVSIGCCGGDSGSGGDEGGDGGGCGGGGCGA
ncbi:hypothetical protein L1887_03553 [Cichorium endivia]|nr:hypothetical protein L1887_03553 [Cichorium endivia]